MHFIYNYQLFCRTHSMGFAKVSSTGRFAKTQLLETYIKNMPIKYRI